jgi:hypothetical protein
VLDLARALHPPLVDTPKERRHIADTLNKIYVESFDSGVLGTIVREGGGEPGKLGNLKRLQMVLEKIATPEAVYPLMTPLFVLYDFRVACSHLTSEATATEILRKVTDRLGLPADADLQALYASIQRKLLESFERLTEIVSKP